MLRPGSFQHVCRNPGEIPAAVLPLVRAEISEQVGSPLRVMFPALSAALPKMAAEFDKHWSAPALACRYVYGEWLLSLVSERPEANVFFPLHLREMPIDGPMFEEDHAMLPLRWRELYRFFNSFCITSEFHQPLSWRNTPLSFSARSQLEDFGEESGASRAEQRQFKKAIGSDRLFCWLWSDAGDALFLDEARNDRKVYHARENRLRDTALLNDPESVLDSYLAHLLAGGTPMEFDFRAG